MDSCSQGKEWGAQKLAKLPFCSNTGRKSQDPLSPKDTEHKHDMETEINAIDKHFHVCAAL